MYLRHYGLLASNLGKKASTNLGAIQNISTDCVFLGLVSGGNYTIAEGVTVTNGIYPNAALGSNKTGITFQNSGNLVSSLSGGLGALQLDNGSIVSGGIWNTATGKMQSLNVWAGIGIANLSSVSGGLLNQGQILSNSGSALTLYNQSSVDVITNLGLIKSNSGTHDVEVGLNSSVGTLNNFQGTSGSGGQALRIKGSMPVNYNLIGYGDQYGQLSILPNSDPDSPLGTLTFDVFSGDAGKSISGSQLTTRVYENVITGIVQADYDNTFTNGVAFGQYNGVAWALTTASWRNGTLDAFGQTLSSDKIWDLVVFNFGQDLAEPQFAMLEQRQHAVRNGLDYDCAQFDKDNVCVSFKSRYSRLGDTDEGAGVLVVARRIDTHLHFGAFIDHRVSGSKINGVQAEPGMPMLGVFADYSAGMDGTGLQARISAAFENGTASISRMNLIDPTVMMRDEVGIDSSGFASQIGWGIGLGNRIVATPFLGLRQTDTRRAAYTEDTADVPFTYDTYRQHRVTGVVGGELNGILGKDVSYQLSAGFEYDFVHQLDEFKAYSPIEGLGDMTYLSASKTRVLRPFGEASLGFVIDATRTVTLEGNVSQADYGQNFTCSIMAGYQMAF